MAADQGWGRSSDSVSWDSQRELGEFVGCGCSEGGEGQRSLRVCLGIWGGSEAWQRRTQQVLRIGDWHSRLVSGRGSSVKLFPCDCCTGETSLSWLAMGRGV